ncbi:MAG TPA: T9SS type A sorting domain-containing protein [Paludibacter sp.]|nr:T9SS type A sorting domain-containing protein [Paludibacter sp.]
MKTKITFFALAFFATVSVNAATPATWSVVASGSASEKGEVAWGDFNNDGNLDLFQVSDNVYKLYQNNGNETFSDVSSSKLPGTLPGGVNESSVIFLDYNNDNNLDILITGWPLANATLYKNSGAPNYTYTIDTQNSLLSVRTGNGENAHAILSAVDYNNDGWVDLFMEGWCDAVNNRVVTLYKNVNGVFTRQTTPVGGTADFEGMNGGSLHTGDINHDGYVDMISSGYSVVGSYRTYLYVNQGDGTFVKSTAAFTGIEQGESVLFDSNNDGWLDVYIAGVGYEGGWVWPGSLYLNNQDGTFTLMASGTNLPSSTQKYTSFASGDTNNDGKTDLMVMLPNGDNTAMYYNNGDNTFLKDILPTPARARAGSMDLADFNNDNKLDYFLFGYNDNVGWLGAFVKNTTAVANLAPAIPANLLATKVNGKYVISWDKSTDDITTQNAISYNIYVQDQSGKVYAYSPADIATGRLKTGSQTLLNKNQITLDLAAGQYTVGVQAVDQANVASAFITTSLSITTGVENTLASKVDVKSINKNIEIQNSGLQKVNVTLLSLSGQLLYKGFCEAGSKTVLPMNLNLGIYLVKLSQDNTTHTVKVSVL